MKIGLVANTGKPFFWEQYPAILALFAKQEVTLTIAESIANAPENPGISQPPVTPDELLPHRCDMILAVGGDGTMLRTIAMIGAKETPVLGINVGGLGFLTEILLESFADEMTKVLAGEYRLEKRQILKADVEGLDKPLYALNEIVLDKGGAIRVIEIEVHIGGEYLNAYVADGLLISTPTGSTGYSLSSGGPIIVPSTNALIINPICPHSLTNRPVIVPSDSKIEIIVRTEAPAFIVSPDGQEVYPRPTRTKICVERAQHSAILVKPLHSNYYRLLHSKLNWGKDFRDKNRWSHNS